MVNFREKLDREKDLAQITELKEIMMSDTSLEQLVALIEIHNRKLLLEVEVLKRICASNQGEILFNWKVGDPLENLFSELDRIEKLEECRNELEGCKNELEEYRTELEEYRKELTDFISLSSSLKECEKELEEIKSVIPKHPIWGINTKIDVAETVQHETAKQRLLAQITELMELTEIHTYSDW